MSATTSAVQLEKALEQVCRHWEKRRPNSARAVTLAIARQAGTQAAGVAQEVGRRLGWPIYDRQLLELVARDMGLQATLLESVDEKQLSWLLDSIESLLDVPHVDEVAFIRHLVKTVLMLGSHGECIIVGRGAPHLLPLETTLRVRLVAPLTDRIAALSTRFGITSDEAARRIESTERQRADFVQHHFLKDPADSANYDLVLNTASFKPYDCADVIVAALTRMQDRLR